jgi:hypothetical protein
MRTSRALSSFVSVDPGEKSDERRILADIESIVTSRNVSRDELPGLFAFGSTVFNRLQNGRPSSEYSSREPFLKHSLESIFTREALVVWFEVQGTLTELQEGMSELLRYLLTRSASLSVVDGGYAVESRELEGTCDPLLNAVPLFAFEPNTSIFVEPRLRALVHWLRETGWFTAVITDEWEDAAYDSSISFEASTLFCGSAIVHKSSDHDDRRYNQDVSSHLKDNYIFLNPCH